MEYRRLGTTGVKVSTHCLGAILDDETLDAIDGVVEPGAVLEESDRGWQPPWMKPAARRQPRWQPKDRGDKAEVFHLGALTAHVRR